MLLGTTLESGGAGAAMAAALGVGPVGFDGVLPSSLCVSPVSKRSIYMEQTHSV